MFVCFADLFPKEAEAINAKTIVWNLGKFNRLSNNNAE